MHKINILSNSVIDKIAAGEVVERPRSVVKELVENSIDAKATAITVEIKEGGKKLIRITDNGIGIPKGEVKKAFIRHATSKIETEDDLNGIISLGFRGEALASIVAVSELEMITKVDSDITGKRIIIEGSDVTLEEEVGAPSGTTILINNLFYNVPARKKFLKSDLSEGTEIAEIMNKLALANPHISFKFINNNKVVLHTPGTSEMINTIFNIYGKEIAKSAISVSSEVSEIKLKGYIGSTSIQRSNRLYENFFVNGRYIKSTLLSEAIEEAYYGYIMKGKFPFCVLNIEIEPELIDINVHPAKTEIRFKNEDLIYNIVFTTLREILMNENHTEVVTLETAKEESVRVKAENKGLELKRSDILEPFEIAKEDTVSYKASSDVKEKRLLDNVEISDSLASEIIKEALEVSKISSNPKIYEDDEIEEIKLDTKMFKDYKIIGQLFNTYWIVQQEDNMYIIDQHAACEKILYEDLKKDYASKNINSQILLEPIVFEVTPKEAEMILDRKSDIENFGFSIDEFGVNTFIVREIPWIFEKIITEDMLREIVAEVTEFKNSKDIKAFDDMFATICCKKAIKANDKQSFMEAKQIIDDLMRLENPFNCPHGRPVIVSLTKYEIERKFKRII